MTKFILRKITVSLGIHLNTWTYNVCGIKLEAKVMRLLKIRVENMSLFLLNKCAVPLPVIFQVQPVYLFTEMYHNCILFINTIFERKFVNVFLLIRFHL